MKVAICFCVEIVLVLTLVGAPGAIAQQLPAGATPQARDDTTHQAAEAAIRQSAQGFTAAFNRGDAAAIAGHFTEDGVYINEHGVQFVGNETIQEEYETFFANRPDARIRLEIDSIRFLNADTAIETGRAAVTPQPAGHRRTISSYTAVHVRQNGKWRVTHVRDTRIELAADVGSLADLDWLIGSWSGERGVTQIEVQYRWLEQQRFLACSYTTKQNSGPPKSGLQIIGVDPAADRITSWSFTSDGGHAVGIWSPRDDGWTVESRGVLADGRLTAAVNILSHVDENTLSWRSERRFVDQQTIPDKPPVLLKRQ